MKLILLKNKIASRKRKYKSVIFLSNSKKNLIENKTKENNIDINYEDDIDGHKFNCKFETKRRKLNNNSININVTDKDIGHFFINNISHLDLESFTNNNTNSNIIINESNLIINSNVINETNKKGK
jgi:hypothetical protein